MVGGRTSRLAGLAMVAAMLAVYGCGSTPEEEPSAEQAADVARSQKEVGPVRLTVEVEPKKARLSDRVELRLTIDAEEAVAVEKPPFGESLGDFEIVDWKDSPVPEIKDGRKVYRQQYTLEPTRTGELVVYPIDVSFTVDGSEHRIESDELAVDVASVVGEEAPSLDDLRPPAGPVELPGESRAHSLWAIAGGAVALVVVVAGGVWWLRRRRRKQEEGPQLTPREMAYLELQKLVEADLAARDVKRYYVELTGIVRRYIERTTGIRAPEQTTEEFLREISGADTFSAEESGRLKSFLESADLVKFAAHQPASRDIEESFERAKAFIGLETVAEVAA